uniref:tail fiber domain-containing protein n=1 Tax=Enterocloster aldenensis TaxID=358742 RepID=UPI001D0921DD
MLDVPEYVKQRCRDDNNKKETVKHLELSFFDEGIDTLYPSNDLYPAYDLYPADAGAAWLTIGMDQICAETVNLTESISSGSNIIWGSCEAAKFIITVADVEDEMTGREFTATLSIGDYKMAYGIYIVDSVTRLQADRRKRKITAYDRMIKFDTDISDWYHAMYPTDDAAHTVKELRDSLCEEIGVPQEQTVLINDGLVVGKTISPESLCGRDVLKAICEINGVFGHFDRTGTLVYISLQDTGLYPSDTLYPGNDLYPQSGWAAAEELEHYRSITYEDYLIDGIDRVQIRQEEGDIGAVVGSGSNAYVVEGNFLAYGLGSADLTKLAWSIYDTIAGKTYRPAKIATYAMPWIEVGDGLRAITTDTEIATFVLTRTMSGIQGMMDTVEAKGTKTQGQEFGIQNEIIQLKGKTAVIVRSVDEVSATVTDLEKQTTAQIKVVSDKIAAEVKRATDQEIELAGSISVLAGQIEAKVSRGDLIASINLEVNKAGSCITMEAGHFVFKGSNFFVNADGSGGAANGNLTWDASGGLVAKNIKLIMADISGTTNSSSIGVSTMSAQNANIDRLTVNGTSDMRDIVSGDIYADDIQCTQIYSSRAGEWWSDRRMKSDINPISPDVALTVTMALKPMTFYMVGADEKDMGFVAQDVADIESDLPLYTMLNGFYALPYTSYVALLAGAIQAQQEQINKMREVLNA